VALGKELARSGIDLCAHGRLIFFPNATHWRQHDEAEAVNQQLAQFFQD
jgi:pimeloyl-ACP methyl ester carboxylesterase